MNDSLITTAEVAERLGRTVRQVHYLIEAGRLAPVIKGNGPRGPMFFDQSHVDTLAASLTDEVAS